MTFLVVGQKSEGSFVGRLLKALRNDGKGTWRNNLFFGLCWKCWLQIWFSFLMTCGDRHAHREKSMPRDVRRSQSSISQGMPKTASSPPEASRQAGNRFFLMALSGNQPSGTLTSDYTPEPRDNTFLSFQTALLVVPCYSSRGKRMQQITNLRRPSI